MIYIIGTMKSTDQRRNTTTSKTDTNRSSGNTRCPTVEGICHSSVHPIKKSASVASAVPRTFLSHLLLPWIFFTFCFIGYSLVEATSPANEAVAKGKQVQLNCSMAGDGTYWKYKNFLGGLDQFIHTGSAVNQKFMHLFFDDKSEKEHVNLRFTSSEKTSGRYGCRQNMETLEQVAHVIVLDAQATCSKEATSGYVNATCSIGYSGYWHPMLEWHNTSGGLETIINDTTTQDNENRNVTSSLIVPFNESDPGASYTLTCTPKFREEDKPAPQKNTVVAPNVPLYPTRCTLEIGGSSEKEEKKEKEESGEQSKQATSSVPHSFPLWYIVGIICGFAYVLPLLASSNCFSSGDAKYTDTLT